MNLIYILFHPQPSLPKENGGPITNSESWWFIK